MFDEHTATRSTTNIVDASRALLEVEHFVIFYQGAVILMENRLTRYELELMDVLWDLGEGTVQQVCDQLERPLAYTTVMTTLSLLHCKKGVLDRNKLGRAFVYRPSISRDEISRSMISDLKELLFGNRLPSLVINLLSEEKMSKSDVAALRAAVEQLEAKS
jgi:predicted transcriptional regulator